ncbi:DUF1538 domain-containing protein [bacterium]|nr:DUF1538 domain-containing protein [bacterium]
MSSNKQEKLKIPLKQSMMMLLGFCKDKLKEQLVSVLPVVIYLIFFQSTILGMPIYEAGVISVGIGLVILGLAFFLEGLFLGIMPLGEILGIKLPLKSGLFTIIAFSFILGFGATYAEPSIAILKANGSFVKPWEAPLLFVMLNQKSTYLVAFVGIGVGIAVVAGMMRFMKSISLKPFILLIIPLLLVFTVWGLFDPNILYITGLAWDCGAVTTGPVTVPLVLALGIGICRTVGGEDSDSMGFGVVTLASAFPILAVYIFGVFLNFSLPQPMTKADFFNPANHEKALQIVGSEEKFEAVTKQFSDAALSSNEALEEAIDIFNVASTKFFEAVNAILPLTLFILLVFVVLLREKLPKKDEIFLGIFISVLGMGLFGIGMEYGLSKIGTQVGSRLPASFSAIELNDSQETMHNFDKTIVQKSITPEGEVNEFFFKKEGENKYAQIPFVEKNYDEPKKIYRYIPQIGPIFGKNGGSGGYLIVILFAFIMGFGATLAEPALNALGMKVEELSVGTFKKMTLIYAVAIGVGLGIALGAVKIIWNIQILWMLVPAYIILLILTAMSDEQYVNIGWDSAGVTTGPVTVPLVLAMGLGLGARVEGVVEGFGILSMASACPILAVLLMGISASRKAKKMQNATNGGR